MPNLTPYEEQVVKDFEEEFPEWTGEFGNAVERNRDIRGAKSFLLSALRQQRTDIKKEVEGMSSLRTFYKGFTYPIEFRRGYDRAKEDLINLLSK